MRLVNIITKVRNKYIFVVIQLMGDKKRGKYSDQMI